MNRHIKGINKNHVFCLLYIYNGGMYVYASKLELKLTY